MKQHKTKALAHITQASGSMLLFLLFAGCMLMMTAVAASTYSRISAGYDEAFGASVPLRYVVNKIKSAQSIELFEDGSGAALDVSGMVCLVYCDGTAVYEKTISVTDYTDGGFESAQDISGGELVASAQSLRISDNGTVYEISVQCGGKTKSAFVRKGRVA